MHLDLRPMNAGFVVDEEAGEVESGVAPMEPKVVTGEAHEHGSHAEVNPAGGVQGPHASIDHGEAGAALAPGGESGIVPVGVGSVELVAGASKIEELEVGGVFELLHEVAVPAEAAGERFEGTFPAQVG